MTAKRQANSNEGFVKDAYEASWSSRIAVVQSKLEAGESLAHILLALRGRAHQVLKVSRIAQDAATRVKKECGFEAGDRLVRPTAMGRFQLGVNIHPIILLGQLARGVRNVVELGSGPGWNLLDIGIFLGRAAEEKKFLALEYTDAGLEVTKLLASHRDAVTIEGHLFDYTRPDLSMVPDDGQTLFFSHHSIEQVEDISEDLYFQLESRQHPVTIVHFEPIGWQRMPELRQARAEENDELFRSLLMERARIDDGAAELVAYAAVNSWRRRYNRNAYSLIMKHVADSRLRLVESLYDFTTDMNTNVVNATSYFHLEVGRDDSRFQRNVVKERIARSAERLKAKLATFK